MFLSSVCAGGKDSYKQGQHKQVEMNSISNAEVLPGPARVLCREVYALTIYLCIQFLFSISLQFIDFIIMKMVFPSYPLFFLFYF